MRGICYLRDSDGKSSDEYLRSMEIRCLSTFGGAALNQGEFRMAERFKAAGYTARPGKPKAGEKTVLGALEAAVGRSRRQIQRVLAGDGLPGWVRVE